MHDGIDMSPTPKIIIGSHAGGGRKDGSGT